MHGNLQRNLNCEEFGYIKCLPIWYHAEKMKNARGYSNKITYSLRAFVFLLDK